MCATRVRNLARTLYGGWEDDGQDDVDADEVLDGPNGSADPDSVTRAGDGAWQCAARPVDEGSGDAPSGGRPGGRPPAGHRRDAQRRTPPGCHVPRNVSDGSSTWERLGGACGEASRK